MSFLKTPTRRLRFVQAIGSLVLALGLLTPLVLGTPLDSTGLGFLLSFSGLLVLVSAFHFWRALRTPPEEVTVHPVIAQQLAPPDKQVRYFRGMIWVSAVAFPVLTGIIAWQLWELESGEVKRMEIVQPIASIYNHFGYWPALLSVPAIGALTCLAFVVKLKSLGAANRAASQAGARPGEKNE